jgi:hypothetical protein
MGIHGPWLFSLGGVFSCFNLAIAITVFIVFASHFWEARDSLRRPYGQKTQGVWRSCSTKSRKQDWPRLRVLLLESHFRHAALLDIRVPLAAFQVSLCLTQESNSGIFIVRGT